MPAQLYFDRVEEGPVTTAFAEGVVSIVTRRGPAKACNEDALGLIPFPGGGVLVVADGMGGQNAGERASRMALEILSERLAGATGKESAARHVIVDGLEAASAAVRDLGIGAGATLAAMILNEGRARTVHVGDAVAVHLGQRGRIKDWTRSHSPTGYAVEAGLLDEEEALHHDERHLVSNFVGQEGMRIEVGPALDVARYDTLLIASDGLSDNLRPEEMIALSRSGPIERASEQLLALAVRRMEQAEPGAPSKPDDLTFLLYRRSS